MSCRAGDAAMLIAKPLLTRGGWFINGQFVNTDTVDAPRSAGAVAEVELGEER